jgi:hypothetical protein
MKTLFNGVYAPSTVGTLLREFTFGHARQSESVMCGHLLALAGRTGLLPGTEVRMFAELNLPWGLTEPPITVDRSTAAMSLRGAIESGVLSTYQKCKEYYANF